MVVPGKTGHAVTVSSPRGRVKIATQPHTLKSCDETFTSDEVAELGNESQPCMESNVGEKVDTIVDDFANKSTDVVAQAPLSRPRPAGDLLQSIQKMFCTGATKKKRYTGHHYGAQCTTQGAMVCEGIPSGNQGKP